MGTSRERGVFIVWAKPGSGSRRAAELGKRFDLDVHYVIPGTTRGRVSGYWAAMRRTREVLRRGYGGPVWVQVAPAIAAVVVARQLKTQPLVLDAHSSFFEVRWRLNRLMLRGILRRCTAVVIHNPLHAEDVTEAGGHPFLLPDPLFSLPVAPHDERCGSEPDRVFVPLSWRPDEPLQLIAEVAAMMPQVLFCLSGRPRGRMPRWPRNVRVLGFLNEERYAGEMCRCRVVWGLTTQENTVLCAAHEAMGMGRRLVLSDTEALRWRFGSIAFFARNQANDMVDAIQRALRVPDGDFLPQWEKAASEMEQDWHRRKSELEALLSAAAG